MSTTNQWNLRAVRAEEAFDLLPKLPGSNIVAWHDIQVAHIDTGVRRHPAFGPWSEGESDTLLLEDGENYKEKGELPLDPMNYKKQFGELRKV